MNRQIVSLPLTQPQTPQVQQFNGLGIITPEAASPMSITLTFDVDYNGLRIVALGLLGLGLVALASQN
jgi:hypothetical protein